VTTQTIRPYKNKDGTWSYRYREAGRSGKRPRVGPFETKGEASEHAAETLRRLRMGSLYRESVTLAVMVDRWLKQHQVDAWRRKNLGWLLGKWVAAFGDIPIDQLQTAELAAFRLTIPEGHRHEATAALKQVLRAAVEWEPPLLDRSPAAAIRNPLPKRREKPHFDSWAEVDRVSAELPERFRPIPVFVAGTGLSPEEWIPLERRDIDRKARTVHVRRVYVRGELREYGKHDKRLRAVPLRARALQALDAIPARLDTPLLFPGERRRFLDLHNWRARHWHPAVEAAGLALCECGHLSGDHDPEAHRCEGERCRCREFKRAAGSMPPNALRHTFAVMALRARWNLFELARMMGTSVEMIDQHYGHLAPADDQRLLEMLDTYDAAIVESDPASEETGTDA
jgi:hypothetical protein